MATVVKIKRMSDNSELVKEDWFDLDKEYCEIAGIECDDKHWGMWYHNLEGLAYLLGNQVDCKTNIAANKFHPLGRNHPYQFSWKECVPALYMLVAQFQYAGETLQDFKDTLDRMIPTIHLFERHSEEFYLDIRF